MIYVREDEDPSGPKGKRRASPPRSPSPPKVSKEKAKGKQIYVGNMPYSVDKYQLREAFKEFGKIVLADVPMDERGKSRGYGIVLYD